MRRRLSTIFTFPAMFTGPLLVTVAVLLGVYYYLRPDSATRSDVAVIIGLCGFIGAICWISFIWHRSRRVFVDGENFYVSNYLLKEITIPIGEVKSVTEIIYSRNNFVELNLAHPTRIGQVVRFMPRLRSNARFGASDPVVQELRDLIDKRKQPLI